MTEPQQIGFAPGFEYKGLEEFKGLNTKARRPSIDDEECAWLENLMPIGKGNLRSLYDVGTTLFTAPAGTTIVYYAQFNIANTDYFFVVLSDGTARQVQQSNGAVITLGVALNTFYNGGDLPRIAQYGISGIVIITTAVTDGYYAWDGALWSPGTAAPAWLSGLTAAVTAAGNETSGSATLSGFSSTVGIVVGMWVTGSGIPANTFVTGGSSTTVTISNNATATANGVTFTFNWQMPTGIKGTGLDIYQSRVFIVNGAQRLMSASGNGAYFAAANGGSIATSNDSGLRKKYTSAIAANGYIYLFGDDSIWNISNVTQTVTNNVATASYQYNNSDPQTGTLWPNSVQIFGRAIIFVNANGVWSLLGNSATKISDALDGIFATLDTSVAPTSAVATLFGIRCLVVLVRGKDYLGVNRNILCLFEGKHWFVASQSITPTFITSNEVSSNLTAWGTDGTVIYPLFQTAGTGITKTLQSKLYGGRFGFLSQKQALRYYLQLQQNTATAKVPSVTIDTEATSQATQGSLSAIVTWTNNVGTAITWQNNAAQNVTWIGAALVLAVDAPQSGNLLGFTFTSTAEDFTIQRTGVGYREETALY